MRRSLGKFNKGLTLVEVMVTILVALVIVTGVMMYMYSSALNAHEADVRAIASRLNLLLLEGWKTKLGETNPYDPALDFFDSSNPAIPFEEITAIDPAPADPPGLDNATNTFRYYRIKIDGVKYFVKMTYADSSTGQRTLNVAVAWNRNYQTDSLDDYHSSRMVSMTKFASYIVE